MNLIVHLDSSILYFSIYFTISLFPLNLRIFIKIKINECFYVKFLSICNNVFDIFRYFEFIKCAINIALYVLHYTCVIKNIHLRYYPVALDVMYNQQIVAKYGIGDMG